jgi:hypothetical protein
MEMGWGIGRLGLQTEEFHVVVGKVEIEAMAESSVHGCGGCPRN